MSPACEYRAGDQQGRRACIYRSDRGIHSDTDQEYHGNGDPAYQVRRQAERPDIRVWDDEGINRYSQGGVPCGEEPDHQAGRGGECGVPSCGEYQEDPEEGECAEEYHDPDVQQSGVYDQ